jgi:dihydrolipoamide dehydrogenase
MADRYDVVVIGSGPGGYVAAIACAQKGKKAAIVEKEDLGGVCLNWGCIPTKALIKSAEVLETIKHAEAFGINVGEATHDFAKVVERSRGVAAKMSAGIDFLMKKNKIDVIIGDATLKAANTVSVSTADGEKMLQGDAVIVATGASARTFPNLPVDGERVFHYRRAMAMPEQPESLLCIGAGAIGMEFGYFYNAMGTKVTVVEALPQIIPTEDAECAKLVERTFKKAGVDIKTGTMVKELKVTKTGVDVTFTADEKETTETFSHVLVAVGMAANTAGVGLDTIGIELDERGFIKVDANQQTNAPGVYAIGDCAGRQLLAHKASFEGEAAAAHIGGGSQPVHYDQVPGCFYFQPQVASVGLTEAKAKEAGHKLKIGRFNFQASGKAQAVGHPEGFVKLIFDAEYDQLIGAHLVGYDATELLAELSLAMRLEATASEILHTIHAHPTLSEAVMESAGDALGICIHQ